PQINNGVARRSDPGPKILENREMLEGKIEDVPKPVIPAQTESVKLLPDVKITVRPNITTKRPATSILSSSR
ncbi:hypothetical protein OFM15_31550, partial [Escherichia coli]|nr:hypothetical protein [Escherichia coli]